jgi:hypothetical protein
VWGNNSVHIHLPQSLTAVPLPDQPDTVAFMEGPVVLAGLLGDGSGRKSVEFVDEKTLYGDLKDLSTLFVPDNEREWGNWRSGYRTAGQPENIRFMPLYEIRDERYEVYFPIRPMP